MHALRSMDDMSIKINDKEIKYCGYSNCFRDAVKIRGFMPVCEFYLHNPQKWGKDGMTFTGSMFIKR